ncbi:PEPxxWA-CTERM sorting domain-containing protein [Sphingomonas phyllosphaerae]|uniref:PEPxxWA-CTERM sorting domain-containing protein n=1 Tax=Sphingomonas phyllosphaerae TaxID=257003 RepID=UPI0009DB77E5|nr:PEPxxWA-CTERM sorting domain-containing protein [Sphingomonas phyllosphaerae]
MKVPRLGLTLAAAMSLCWPATAQAALMQVIGSGAWDRDTMASAATSPDSSFSFDFTVDDALVHSPVVVSSFEYRLGGQRIDLAAPTVSFFSELQGGGIAMQFGDMLLSGYGTSLLSAGGRMNPGEGMAMTFSTNIGDAMGRGEMTIRSAAAVPEPATWLLMLAGFGIVGYACRRTASSRPASATRRAASMPG